MFRVVLPAAACITTTRGELRWAVSGATNSTHAASTTDAAGATCTANATRATNTAHTARTSHTTRAAHATYTARAANTTYSTRAANTTNTANTSSTTSPSGQLRRSVAPADVRVAVEIVVVIDGDVVVTPAASPSPSATPERPHHDADANRDRHPGCVVARRRVVNGRIRIYRRAINHGWIVGRHIDDLRIRLFDDDRALAFDDLGFYLLLLVRFQIASPLGLLTHTLHSVHHIALLRQKGVAEVSRPLDIVSQALDQIGQGGQGLNAGVPRLLGHSIGERFVLQARILCKPLLKLDNLERIRGSGKSLGQHRVGKERNRRYESVKLIRRDLCTLVRWLRRLRRLGRLRGLRRRHICQCVSR
jgi:hypothetical protein